MVKKHTMHSPIILCNAILFWFDYSDMDKMRGLGLF